MLPSADQSLDHVSRFSTSIRISEVTHDVRLSSDSYESVDVFADGYKHFARHMATFLGPRRLILDMNACSPLFYE